MAQLLEPQKLMVKDVPADGNCLYRAVAAQLRTLSPTTVAGSDDYGHVRAMCAQMLQERQEEFAPFVDYGDETDYDNINRPRDYASYVERVRSSSDWGGHLELRALAMALNRTIYVYSATRATAMVISANGNDEDTNKLDDDDKEGPIRLSYHLHYYSLGEHYNQVVPTMTGENNEE